jgi:hypothetical protein
VSFAGRNLSEWENVLIYERAEEAAGLLQYQRECKPAWWLSKIGRKSRYIGDLIKGCHNHEYREKIIGLEYLPAFQYRTEIGPVKRLFSTYGDASVMSRCGTQDRMDILRRYDLVIVMCRGVSDVGATVLIHSWLYDALRFAEEYEEPLTVIADESEKLGDESVGLYTDTVRQGIKMQQKHGLEFHGIMQSPHALRPEIFADLVDMSDEVVCYGAGAPQTVKLMAGIMGTPKLKSHKVHHVERTKRQFNDGFDEVTVKDEVPFRDPWKLRDENLTGEVRKRTQLVPRYRVEEEERVVYESGTEQLLQIEHEIATLGKRERFKRQGPFAWREKVRTLRDPYLWPEVSDRRVDQFLEEILDRPEYQPVEIQLPKGKPWVPGKKNGKGSKKK